MGTTVFKVYVSDSVDAVLVLPQVAIKIDNDKIKVVAEIRGVERTSIGIITTIVGINPYIKKENRLSDVDEVH